MFSEKVEKLLTHQEDLEVEFKETIGKEVTDTMVAMANAKGGFILIGVRDTEDKNGRQLGEIVGVNISDENKLKILNKAQSIVDKLFPHIKEETDERGRSIYVVEIPEGTQKPYCTGGGRYLIRCDGNNTATTPGMMEDLMLERITAGPGETEEELPSALQVLEAEFSTFVRRFRDEWVTERDSQPASIDNAKYMLENAFQQVLDFKVRIMSPEGASLPEILGSVLKGFKALLQHRLYIDGGRSYRAFWEAGDEMVQLLEKASAEIASFAVHSTSSNGNRDR